MRGLGAGPGWGVLSWGALLVTELGVGGVQPGAGQGCRRKVSGCVVGVGMGWESDRGCPAIVDCFLSPCPWTCPLTGELPSGLQGRGLRPGGSMWAGLWWGRLLPIPEGLT